MTTLSFAEQAMLKASELALAYVGANPGKVTPDEAVALVPRFFAILRNTFPEAIGHAAPAAVPLPAAPAAVATLPAPAAVAWSATDAEIEASLPESGDYIVCLCDGAHLKMLKRYIKRFKDANGEPFTPETYRAAFGLPADYPMTAPSYSLQKKAEAEAVGLGSAANKAGVAAPRRREAVLEAA
jgi:predicted transcriptional regulator